MKLILAIKDKLDQMNERERRVVTWGSVFVGLCLLWFVLLEPAINTLASANQKQAELVGKAAQVKRAALELEALKSTRSQVIIKDEEALPRLTNLLSQEGLSAAQVNRTESGAIEVNLEQAPVVGVLKWLVQSESLTNLLLEDAQIIKDDDGLVSGSFLFSLNSAGNSLK